MPTSWLHNLHTLVKTGNLVSRRSGKNIGIWLNNLQLQFSHFSVYFSIGMSISLHFLIDQEESLPNCLLPGDFSTFHAKHSIRRHVYLSHTSFDLRIVDAP